MDVSSRAEVSVQAFERTEPSPTGEIMLEFYMKDIIYIV